MIPEALFGHDICGSMVSSFSGLEEHVNWLRCCDKALGTRPQDAVTE